MKIYSLAILALLLAIPATLQADHHEKEGHEHAVDIPKHAIAVLASTNDSKVKGIIRLEQKEGLVHVTGKVINLEPGEHGFHIHEFGDLSKRDGTSAGGHFNPEGHEHGEPGEKSHAGDLGNIKADDKGVAMIDIQAKGLMLHTVFGRAFVVHAKADDLKSQPSGDAGPRVAVGVIGIAQKK